MASDESLGSNGNGVSQRLKLPPATARASQQRRSKANPSTERYQKPNLRRRAYPQRTDSCHPIFAAETVDPEKDKNLVVDAVHFVLSASNKGCCSLVTKVAEQLKYKQSLEEKVLYLLKEVKLLRKVQSSSSQSSGRSTPLSFESDRSRLSTKQSFSNDNKEFNNIGQEMLTEFHLPGLVIPHNTMKTNRVTFENNFNKDLPTVRKNHSATETQIYDLRECSQNPILIEHPSYDTLKDQLKQAQDMIASLREQLSVYEKDKIGDK